MKILEVPDSTWGKTLRCWRCETKFVAEEEDLDYDSWKVSGYHFNDTAVSEMRLYVACPSCKVLTRIDEEEIPVLLMDRLETAYQIIRKKLYG